MAHTKAKGSTKGNRDSRPKYMGVKLHDGQIAKIGSIIIRQRGTKFWPGQGVRLGGDDTIFSVREGKVKFTSRKKQNYDGRRRIVKIVNVL